MILLDEPSMGLAPQLVEEIFEIVKTPERQRKGQCPFSWPNKTQISRSNTRPTAISWRSGQRSFWTAMPQALRENEDVKEFYLGVAGDNRKSFKNVKHYKRRKRWLS